MKLALNYRDLEQFRGFASAARQLTDWLGVEPRDQIVMLESQLYLTQDSTVQNQIKLDLARMRFTDEQLSTIRTWRYAMFFGFGGWLMHLAETNSMPRDGFSNYIPIVGRNFIDLHHLYNLYAWVIKNPEFEDQIAWGRWELEERPESYGDIEVEPILTSDWLSRYSVDSNRAFQGLVTGHR